MLPFSLYIMLLLSQTIIFRLILSALEKVMFYSLPLLQIISHFDFLCYIHFAMYLEIIIRLDIYSKIDKKIKVTYNLERRE